MHYMDPDRIQRPSERLCLGFEYLHNTKNSKKPARWGAGFVTKNDRISASASPTEGMRGYDHSPSFYPPNVYFRPPLTVKPGIMNRPVALVLVA